MFYTKTNASKLQAHRGVSTEYPENTMPAFIAAIKQGYDIIELDPGFTSDGEIVILHDLILNRTVRNPDGSEIKDKTYIHNCTSDYIRNLDAGSWFSDEFKGVKIPFFEEIISLSKDNNIPIKIDNKFQRFYTEEVETMFNLIRKYEAGELVQFTCNDLYFIDYVVSNFPKSAIHYDGYIDKWHMDQIKSSLKDNPLITWLRYDNPTSAWCKTPAVSVEKAEFAKQYGQIGIWILSEDEEAEIAADTYGADYIETTGSIKPNIKL